MGLDLSSFVVRILLRWTVQLRKSWLDHCLEFAHGSTQSIKVVVEALCKSSLIQVIDNA